MVGKRLISLVQLSDETRLSIRFLNEAISEGTLIAERVGGRWIIDREDAEEFLAEVENDCVDDQDLNNEDDGDDENDGDLGDELDDDEGLEDA